MSNATTLMSHRDKVFFAILAIMVIPISGLSIDIYAPSLPSVVHYFNADKSLVQLTITSYMLGLSIMQLFAGGIVDSFGRRKPFLIANTIFILASLAIPFTQNIYQLLALRCIQGTAVAATVVPMRSIVPDLFEGRELHKWMNFMVMAWSIGPIIAPAIGGYLQHYLGWKSNFYFLGLYSLIMGIMIYCYLPETSKHRHEFHIIAIYQRYKEILLNTNFLSLVLMNGLLYSLLIIFTVAGPFLVQSTMHYTAIAFGNMALALGLLWFLGTMTNKFLLDIPYKKKAGICLWVIFTISIAMLVAALLSNMNLYVLLIPALIIAWLAGIIFPNNAAKSITLFPKMTGSANAAFGATIYCCTSITSALATNLHATSLIPFSIAYIALIIVCLLIYYYQRKKSYI